MGKKISCLGPSGSYSELALKKWIRKNNEEGGDFSEKDILLCPRFADVLASLVRGVADYAVLPIENSIRGSVYQNLDALTVADVFAVDEILLDIDHRLATKAGVPVSQIKKIYSHEQALGQCSRYLQKQFPYAEYIYTTSTAESLCKLDDHSAGIVGGHIHEEGITISEENVADEKTNQTRFLLLVRRDEANVTKSKRIFFCAVCRHEPGTLFALLGIFARYGKNLTRIESRPIKGTYGEYRFFIEFEGDYGDNTVQQMIEEAKGVCTQFRFLGAYN